jgi:hypothetical protein
VPNLNLVELETDKGPAYVSLAHIIAVGAAFTPRPPGRPKSRRKAEDDDEPEVSARRALFMQGGDKIYILDTQENLQALGLD